MVTANYAHYNYIYMPDPTSRIRFGSVLPKNTRITITVQNRPGSDLDGLVRSWPNGSGPEASRCAKIIGARFWQNATDPLPISHFQTRWCSSTNCLDRTVQNQRGHDCVLADCVRFWPNGCGPKANRCARVTGPAPCQRFRADPDRKRFGSGMFTW